jgi:multidrug efflux system membrane fusion protein
VQRGTDGLYAYIVKTDKTVEKRPLKVGVIDQGVAVVEDGIKAGETVVVSGQYKLKPGALVELGDETPVARNGAAS